MTSNNNNNGFETFLSQLKETNATLDFFCDFNKVEENVQKVEFNLNKLNYLIGKDNMEEAIRFVWEQDPSAFSVLDIIIAVRKKDKKKVIDDKGNVTLIENYFDSVDSVITFICQTI